MSAWDLTALVNAANAKAGQADRNLWLIRRERRAAPPLDAPTPTAPHA